MFAASADLGSVSDLTAAGLQVFDNATAPESGSYVRVTGSGKRLRNQDTNRIGVDPGSTHPPTCTGFAKSKYDSLLNSFILRLKLLHQNGTVTAICSF